ncbi:MAG: mechanosensitive ion channel protein MscS [Cellvibrionales bacterium TMED49]|nr:mechanosensitive ion channel protein MscS [Porticoccaceae bacterium]OUU37706.1 MAG: mechanosensitive ion channel protein MscS [Cellvibrionales bacterium TMED49]
MDNFSEGLNSLVGRHYLWVLELFIVVFAVLLAGYFVNLLVDRFSLKASKTATVWDDALIEACRKPIVWLIWILGVNFAASIAARKIESDWLLIIEPINRLAVIFLGALFLNNFIKRAESNLIDPRFTLKPMDTTTVRAVARLLRTAVLITSFLIAMQLFGYSISGLLAFGGIGGIAVGFAAKDLLANFFGGLMIYLDRPFSVGDWVRSPDQEIEGTVEDIGWRLTRIRTFDKRPLYIPNCVFANISVENPSRMSHRRIFETIGIRYSDIDRMNPIVEKVRSMLKSHGDIDSSETLIVNFNQFSPSSIDFFVYSFTKTTDWIKFHQVKQEILLNISDIIISEGAEVAFPTTTIDLSEEGSSHAVSPLSIGAVGAPQST